MLSDLFPCTYFPPHFRPTIRRPRRTRIRHKVPDPEPQEGFSYQDLVSSRIRLSFCLCFWEGDVNNYVLFCWSVTCIQALFSRHPVMADWPADHDWFFAKLAIQQVAVLDYFGGAKYVPLEEYYAATPFWRETRGTHVVKDLMRCLGSWLVLPLRWLPLLVTRPRVPCQVLTYLLINWCCYHNLLYIYDNYTYRNLNTYSLFFKHTLTLWLRG